MYVYSKPIYFRKYWSTEVLSYGSTSVLPYFRSPQGRLTDIEVDSIDKDSRRDRRKRDRKLHYQRFRPPPSRERLRMRMGASWPRDNRWIRLRWVRWIGTRRTCWIRWVTHDGWVESDAEPSQSRWLRPVRPVASDGSWPTFLLLYLPGMLSRWRLTCQSRVQADEYSTEIRNIFEWECFAYMSFCSTVHVHNEHWLWIHCEQLMILNDFY